VELISETIKNETGIRTGSIVSYHFYAELIVGPRL
jgi:hypothetical protein